MKEAEAMNDYNPSSGGYFFPSGHGFGIGWTKNTGPSFGDLYTQVGSINGQPVYAKNGVDLITISPSNSGFDAFATDLMDTYNDATFNLSVESHYGNMWVIGNSTITNQKSSFSGISSTNYWNFGVATAFGIASNGGGREVVAVGFTTDITVAIGPVGVFYEHGSFRYKGKDYAVLTIGHAMGVDVSVALNTFQIWADPSTFSPFDLAGQSTQENVSIRWFSGSSEFPFSPGGHYNGSYLGTSQGFGFGVTLGGGSHVTGTTYVWEITPGPTLYDLYKSRPGGY